MHRFPRLTHIRDVLPHVEQHPNFVRIEGDCGNTYIDYVVQGDDTFPQGDTIETMIRRECRGIAFCTATGEIRSRPFHKFFNLDERPQTLFGALAWDQPFHAQVKIDGSMVRPIRTSGLDEWRLATRKGITDTACAAEHYLAITNTDADYDGLITTMMACGLTPIFEWCDPARPIVIRHERPSLTLLAARKLHTGEYYPYEQLRATAEDHRVPVVPLYDMSDPVSEVRALRAMEGTEGIVLVFGGGSRVKVKTDWYAQLHRVKSSLTRERDVVSMTLENRIDDVLQLLTPEMKEELLAYQDKVIEAINSFGAGVRRQRTLIKRDMTRKEFALSSVAKSMDPLRLSILFATWDDDRDLDNVIRSVVRKHVMSNRMYRRLQPDVLAALPRWEEIYTGDE